MANDPHPHDYEQDLAEPKRSVTRLYATSRESLSSDYPCGKARERTSGGAHAPERGPMKTVIISPHEELPTYPSATDNQPY